MSTYSRVFSAPTQSFFLLGARGTGKSTFLKEQFEDATFIDLLSEKRYQRYLSNPGDFFDELSMLPPGSWVVVDEVQRLPQLLNEVHRLIENQKLQFVLSGSSARKLRRAGVNLLAGRALKCHMYPLLPTELGKDFDLKRVLQYGSIAIVWSAKNPTNTLEAYVETYVKEEIQAEGLVRNLPSFSRFLPIASLLHGQIINIASVARDAGISRAYVDDYITLLEDTLLGFRLPAFEAGLRVKERSKPKFYWIDPGLVQSINKRLDWNEQPRLGHLFEGWIVQTVRACVDYGGLADSLSYWSSSQSKRTEVDLLVHQGKDIIAIEIKYSPKVNRQDLAGLHAFSLKNVRRKIVVHTGDTSKQMEGIDILNVHDFIDTLQKGFS